MSVEGSLKRVLVTGANKGIGRAICQLLLEKHPDIYVLLGSRDEGRGEQAEKELRDALGADVCDERLEMVKIDTSSDESVLEAAKKVATGGTLYGIINNAAIGFNNNLEDTVNTNFHGPKRVNEAFGKLLEKPGGKIVNVASASGPMFISECRDQGLRKLGEPLTLGGIEELEAIAKKTGIRNAYGFSKALLNAYTVLHAKAEPDLVINSCTPGYIKTDMTKAFGASDPPSKGAVPPVWLLTSPDLIQVPTGRYYGSDCIRSPLNVYRGPGDPPYEGP